MLTRDNKLFWNDFSHGEEKNELPIKPDKKTGESWGEGFIIWFDLLHARYRDRIGRMIDAPVQPHQKAESDANHWTELGLVT